MTATLKTIKSALSGSPKAAESLSPVKDCFTALLCQFPVDTAQLAEALKECADAGRDEEWRVPLGESGILEIAAGLLDKEIEKEEKGDVEVMRQALRVCGNLCAEKDVNRERMSSRPNGLKSIIEAVIRDELLVFAIPVLYNICLDYEAAQKQAIKDGVGEALLTLLSRADVLDIGNDEGVLTYSLVEHIFNIAESLVTRDDFKESLDPSAINLLLKLALNPQLIDLDLYTYLLNIITALLGHNIFQTHVIHTNKVELLLSILEDSYSRFREEEKDQDSVRILTQLRKLLIIGLSDVSGNVEFTKQYPLDTSPLLKKLHSWLSAPPRASGAKKAEDDPSYLLSEALQTSACIILGNVATSDAACLVLVNSQSIHVPLIAIMGQKGKDYGTVFSAVGMLRNLVLPGKNKVVIGAPRTGIWAALESRWEHALEGGVERQVPYAVSGLGRLLVKGCVENAVRMLEDARSQDGEGVTTRLSVLLRVHDKMDEVPMKTEITRTICEVLKCVAVWKKQPEKRLEGVKLSLKEAEERILNKDGKYVRHGRIGKLIGSMVAQDKWPPIRSEGLFALGLLAAGFGASGASEGDGARLAWAVKEEWWPIVSGEKDTGKDEEREEKEENKENRKEQDEKKNEGDKEESGKVTAEMNGSGEADNKAQELEPKPKPKSSLLQGKDAANALVLVAEVRRRLDGELLPEERSQLDGLIDRLKTIMVT
ncbi:armadillo-type protein [Kalaharituber pfeilii]|nr:armadillo-type protein [Kalaharituber pfeilii]